MLVAKVRTEGGVGADNRVSVSLETNHGFMPAAELALQQISKDIILFNASRACMCSFKNVFNIITFDLENNLKTYHQRSYGMGITCIYLKGSVGLEKKIHGETLLI